MRIHLPRLNNVLSGARLLRREPEEQAVSSDEQEATAEQLSVDATKVEARDGDR